MLDGEQELVDGDLHYDLRHPADGIRLREDIIYQNGRPLRLVTLGPRSCYVRALKSDSACAVCALKGGSSRDVCPIVYSELHLDGLYYACLSAGINSTAWLPPVDQN